MNQRLTSSYGDRSPARERVQDLAGMQREAMTRGQPNQQHQYHISQQQMSNVNSGFYEQQTVFGNVMYSSDSIYQRAFANSEPLMHYVPNYCSTYMLPIPAHNGLSYVPLPQAGYGANSSPYGIPLAWPPPSLGQNSSDYPFTFSTDRANANSCFVLPTYPGPSNATDCQTGYFQHYPPQVNGMAHTPPFLLGHYPSSSNNFFPVNANNNHAKNSTYLSHPPPILYRSGLEGREREGQSTAEHYQIMPQRSSQMMASVGDEAEAQGTDVSCVQGESYSNDAASQNNRASHPHQTMLNCVENKDVILSDTDDMRLNLSEDKDCKNGRYNFDLDPVEINSPRYRNIERLLDRLSPLTVCSIASNENIERLTERLNNLECDHARENVLLEDVTSDSVTGNAAHIDHAVTNTMESLSQQSSGIHDSTNVCTQKISMTPANNLVPDKPDGSSDILHNVSSSEEQRKSVSSLIGSTEKNSHAKVSQNAPSMSSSLSVNEGPHTPRVSQNSHSPLALDDCANVNVSNQMTDSEIHHISMLIRDPSLRGFVRHYLKKNVKPLVRSPLRNSLNSSTELRSQPQIDNKSCRKTSPVSVSHATCSYGVPDTCLNGSQCNTGKPIKNRTQNLKSSQSSEKKHQENGTDFVNKALGTNSYHIKPTQFNKSLSVNFTKPDSSDEVHNQSGSVPHALDRQSECSSSVLVHEDMIMNVNTIDACPGSIHVPCNARRSKPPGYHDGDVQVCNGDAGLLRDDTKAGGGISVNTPTNELRRPVSATAATRANTSPKKDPCKRAISAQMKYRYPQQAGLRQNNCNNKQAGLHTSSSLSDESPDKVIGSTGNEAIPSYLQKGRSCRWASSQRGVSDNGTTAVEPLELESFDNSFAILDTYSRLKEITPRIQEGTLSLLNCLPDELLLHILSYLLHSDLVKCARVNKRIHRVTMDDSLWKHISVLKRSDLTDKIIHRIGQHHPVSLTLERCHGDQMTTLGLKELLRQCSQCLKELHVIACTRGPLDGDTVLLHASVLCHAITTLDMSWCNISDNGIMAIVSSCKTLTSLQINGCPAVSDEGFLSVCKNHGHSLHTLELFGCFGISAAGIKQIGTLCKCLVTLNLGQCHKMTDSSLTYITGANPNLETLDLRGCKLLQNKTISKLIKSCPKLTSLSVANCPNISDKAVSEIALQLSNLRCLDVCGCQKITDISICSLASHCTRLQSVDISSTGCTQKSIQSLSTHCYSHLHTAKLNFLKYTTRASIVHLLQSCHKLLSVQLYGWNTITNMTALTQINPHVKIEI